MQKNIDYKTTRALQITTVFVGTLALQWALNFSHAGWIGFAVMMIYVGFDPGTSMHRTIHRFWGAMLGLFLSYILFFFIRFNNDMIFVVVPAVVFFAFFSLSKYYFSPTIFTVTLTALGSDYYHTAQYNVDQFFWDYGKATTLALGICVCFEYFIFRKTNLTGKFYADLQQKLCLELDTLFQLVSAKTLQKSAYLKLSVQCNNNIAALRSFLALSKKHAYHVTPSLFENEKAFDETAEDIFHNIRELFVLGVNAPEALRQQTKALLNKLEQLCHDVTLKGD